MQQTIDKAKIARELGAVPIDEKRRIAMELGAVPAAGVAPPQTQPWYSRLLKGSADVATGVAKGAVSTGLGISKALGAVPRETTLADLAVPFSGGDQVIGQPEGSAQNTGFAAEQIGEFFVPSAAAARVPRIAAMIARGGKAGLAARTAVEGAGAFGVSGVQTGGDIEAASLGGAIDAGFTAAFGAASPLILKFSRKAMTTAISPSVTDIKHGFRVGNVFKHNLQGSIPQMAQKTKAKIGELAGQLQSAVAKHGDVEIDALNLLQESSEAVRRGGAKNFGKLSDLQAAETKFIDELAQIAPSGKVGLVEAQKLKQAVGEMGAFADGVSTLEMRALENLANEFYSKIRIAVEAGAPEVRAINKALSEVIPINAALIRRLPAHERKRFLELGDMIVISGATGAIMSGSPIIQAGGGVAGLLMLSRMTHSAKGSQLLNAAGQGLPAAGRTLGRTAAAIAGENSER